MRTPRPRKLVGSGAGRWAQGREGIHTAPPVALSVEGVNWSWCQIREEVRAIWRGPVSELKAVCWLSQEIMTVVCHQEDCGLGSSKHTVGYSPMLFKTHTSQMRKLRHREILWLGQDRVYLLYPMGKTHRNTSCIEKFPSFASGATAGEETAATPQPVCGYKETPKDCQGGDRELPGIYGRVGGPECTPFGHGADNPVPVPALPFPHM